VNAGVSVKNIGGMTFKDANNASNNYALNIPPSSTNGLTLNEFQNVNSLEETLNSGYLINNSQIKTSK
jgi:hypothetical protein